MTKRKPKIDHKYLWEILENFRFPKEFIELIKTMYSKAKTCHDSFPELSPIDQICSVSLGLTPFLSYPALQVTPILPNYAQLCWRVPFPLLHSQVPEPSLECTPPASGMPRPSKIMWSSCDDHATMCHLCHLVCQSLSWWTWDLRVPTLLIFNLFSSHCRLILL